ncbi:unnamed protein product [Blepharisma stoltei]|uniref:RGS domain-containing protein n=1 Tax=Blepharisma stoltei TaxID=1481888 RepID=A0AAU9I9T2_9CILI|nr:unnamed protein product [Blepharisma stoltei]
MGNALIILDVTWGLFFVAATVIYLILAIYIYKKRNIGELFARSPGILIFSIASNYIDTVSSITLGIYEFLGESDYEINSIPAYIIYNISHQALFASNILRIYRLNLLEKIRTGAIVTHTKYLNRKARLTSWWNIKMSTLYIIPVSSIFIVLKVLELSYSMQNTLTHSLKSEIELAYYIFWFFTAITEQVLCFIFIYKIRNVQTSFYIKLELCLFSLIWSIGIISPLCDTYPFHLYTVPIRNLIMILVTISSLLHQTIINRVVPLPELMDSRLIIENESVHRHFRRYINRIKCEKWVIYLDILVKISIFKLKPTIQEAKIISRMLITNQMLFSENLSKDIMDGLSDTTEVEESIFDEIQIFIIDQFDTYIYPKFKNSSCYSSLAREADELLEIL